MLKSLVITSFITSIIVFNVSAASIDKAKMLSDHSLKSEAKLELIDIIYSKSSNVDKAEAYYLLGNIAFEESNVGVALNSWIELTKEFPKSAQAKLVGEKIEQLSEIVGESTKERINNAVAASYIRHGDFWSKGKDTRFTIDSSWLKSFDASLKWYDKAIVEFPKTTAAKVAYQEKIRTLLGWKESGRYGSSFGVQKDFKLYSPILIKTFKSFEQDFPKASTLQAFRYQIAQSYWKAKDFDNTRKWLNKIIDKAGEGDSFYKNTAMLRLEKVEY